MSKLNNTPLQIRNTCRNNKIFIFIILFLLILSLYYASKLRSIGYALIPENYIILDERTWVWQGLSIRSTGIPAGWSNLSAYWDGWTKSPSYNKSGVGIKRFNVAINNALPNLYNYPAYPKPVVSIQKVDFGRGADYIRFVQPLTEEPPLGGIILSQFVPNNVKTFLDLKPADFRKGSLYIAVLTGVLIFILSWQVFRNPIPALIASTIYGSVPSYVLLSRYALLENILSPLILILMNLLIIAKKLQNSHWASKILFLSGLTTGLISLTKLTGYPIIGMAVILLWLWKFGRKQIIIFMIPALILGLSYFLWAFYLSGNFLLNIFEYQSVERGFIGSVNFLVTLSRVGILNFPFDGWWIGGFLTLTLIPFKKDYLPIFAGAITVILTSLMLGGANYPWYFIPLIPFMCISTAYFIWTVATKPSFLNTAILFLVFFSSSFYWGYGVFQASLQSTNYRQPFQLYRIALALAIGGSIGAYVYQNKRLFNDFWFVSIMLLTSLLFKWNWQSVYYIISHWSKLPAIYTPGAF